MAVRFIGSISKIDKYLLLARSSEASVQLGDLNGLLENSLYDLDYKHHRLLLGDNDYGLSRPPHCLKQYGTYETNTSHRIFYVSGGPARNIAILKSEVSYLSLKSALDRYKDIKPTIMFTHIPPLHIARKCNLLASDCVTTQAFKEMLEIHKPILWIFGHHLTETFMFNDESTSFLCVGQDSHVDLSI